MDIQVEPGGDVWGKVDIVDANSDGYNDVVIYDGITARDHIHGQKEVFDETPAICEALGIDGVTAGI